MPLFRFWPERLMVAVSVAVLVFLAKGLAGWHDGITDKRVVIPVAAVVASVYGAGSMRRPLMFLWPLVVWVACPEAVDHPSPDLINGVAAGCFVAWIIGAPAGWIARRINRPVKPDPLPLE
jgi:hypothetical protein